MHEPGIGCLQQVWSIKRVQAGSTHQCAPLDNEDMNSVGGIEFIDAPPIQLIDGLVAITVNSDLMTQAKILFEQLSSFRIRWHADNLDLHSTAPRCAARLLATG